MSSIYAKQTEIAFQVSLLVVRRKTLGSKFVFSLNYLFSSRTANLVSNVIDIYILVILNHHFNNQLFVQMSGVRSSKHSHLYFRMFARPDQVYQSTQITSTAVVQIFLILLRCFYCYNAVKEVMRLEFNYSDR